MQLPFDHIAKPNQRNIMSSNLDFVFFSTFVFSRLISQSFRTKKMCHFAFSELSLSSMALGNLYAVDRRPARTPMSAFYRKKVAPAPIPEAPASSQASEPEEMGSLASSSNPKPLTDEPDRRTALEVSLDIPELPEEGAYSSFDHSCHGKLIFSRSRINDLKF